jgi:hypothetical protein
MTDPRRFSCRIGLLKHYHMEKHHEPVLLIIQAVRSYWSVFSATAESNLTHVRRSVHYTRIALKDTYYPCVRSWLETLSVETLYLTLDEASHNGDYQLFSVGLSDFGTKQAVG